MAQEGIETIGTQEGTETTGTQKVTETTGQLITPPITTRQSPEVGASNTGPQPDDPQAEASTSSASLKQSPDDDNKLENDIRTYLKKAEEALSILPKSNQIEQEFIQIYGLDTSHIKEHFLYLKYLNRHLTFLNDYLDYGQLLLDRLLEKEKEKNLEEPNVNKEEEIVPHPPANPDEISDIYSLAPMLESKVFTFTERRDEKKKEIEKTKAKLLKTSKKPKQKLLRQEFKKHKEAERILDELKKTHDSKREDDVKGILKKKLPTSIGIIEKKIENVLYDRINAQKDLSDLENEISDIKYTNDKYKRLKTIHKFINYFISKRTDELKKLLTPEQLKKLEKEYPSISNSQPQVFQQKTVLDTKKQYYIQKAINELEEAISKNPKKIKPPIDLDLKEKRQKEKRQKEKLQKEKLQKEKLQKEKLQKEKLQNLKRSKEKLEDLNAFNNKEFKKAVGNANKALVEIFLKKHPVTHEFLSVAQKTPKDKKIKIAIPKAIATKKTPKAITEKQAKAEDRVKQQLVDELLTMKAKEEKPLTKKTLKEAIKRVRARNNAAKKVWEGIDAGNYAHKISDTLNYHDIYNHLRKEFRHVPGMGFIPRVNDKVYTNKIKTIEGKERKFFHFVNRDHWLRDEVISQDNTIRKPKANVNDIIENAKGYIIKDIIKTIEGIDIKDALKTKIGIVENKDTKQQSIIKTIENENRENNEKLQDIIKTIENEDTKKKLRNLIKGVNKVTEKKLRDFKETVRDEDTREKLQAIIKIVEDKNTKNNLQTIITAEDKDIEKELRDFIKTVKNENTKKELQAIINNVKNRNTKKKLQAIIDNNVKNRNTKEELQAIIDNVKNRNTKNNLQSKALQLKALQAIITTEKIDGEITLNQPKRENGINILFKGVTEKILELGQGDESNQINANFGIREKLLKALDKARKDAILKAELTPSQQRSLYELQKKIVLAAVKGKIAPREQEEERRLLYEYAQNLSNEDKAREFKQLLKEDFKRVTKRDKSNLWHNAVITPYYYTKNTKYNVPSSVKNKYRIRYFFSSFTKEGNLRYAEKFWKDAARSQAKAMTGSEKGQGPTPAQALIYHTSAFYGYTRAAMAYNKAGKDDYAAAMVQKASEIKKKNILPALYTAATEIRKGYPQVASELDQTIVHARSTYGAAEVAAHIEKESVETIKVEISNQEAIIKEQLSQSKPKKAGWLSNISKLFSKNKGLNITEPIQTPTPTIPVTAPIVSPTPKPTTTSEPTINIGDDSYTIKNLGGNGDCLFRVVAYHLRNSGESRYKKITAKKVRKLCCDYMKNNLKTFGVNNKEHAKSFKEIIKKMREETTWGTALEVAAMEHAFGYKLNYYEEREDGNHQLHDLKENLSNDIKVKEGDFKGTFNILNTTDTQGNPNHFVALIPADKVNQEQKNTQKVEGPTASEPIPELSTNSNRNKLRDAGRWSPKVSGIMVPPPISSGQAAIQNGSKRNAFSRISKMFSSSVPGLNPNGFDPLRSGIKLPPSGSVYINKNGEILDPSHYHPVETNQESVDLFTAIVPLLEKLDPKYNDITPKKIREDYIVYVNKNKKGLNDNYINYINKDASFSADVSTIPILQKMYQCNIEVLKQEGTQYKYLDLDQGSITPSSPTITVLAETTKEGTISGYKALIPKEKAKFYEKETIGINNPVNTGTNAMETFLHYSDPINLITGAIGMAFKSLKWIANKLNPFKKKQPSGTTSGSAGSELKLTRKNAKNATEINKLRENIQKEQKEQKEQKNLGASAAAFMGIADGNPLLEKFHTAINKKDKTLKNGGPNPSKRTKTKTKTKTARTP
ncbi:hypothetical protein [Abyssalbus ytuae]|uniref:OTU domain-containing protein n=1 Tax=Abyssalbus ytuae TaxID=2926907 RepID=A0A9E7A270_9FLAO|nr:hypothetical protein [Abyssalbus ytuae]UOB18411.1 hypothetical protein MQE35_03765 [Abyssalbus ytuae]